MNRLGEDDSIYREGRVISRCVSAGGTGWVMTRTGFQSRSRVTEPLLRLFQPWPAPFRSAPDRDAAPGGKGVKNLMETLRPVLLLRIFQPVYDAV